ncbi:MAG: DoxX family membrane protein [Alphaproteobacteria bacterium]|nr:DoxX family membrane protein [Alphaproteobacteria bacterium]
MTTLGASQNPAGRPLSETLRLVLGWRIYGLGVIHMAVVALVIGSFLPGEAVPETVPGRPELAYAAAGFMLLAGVALQWRRTTAWAAAALGAYFGVAVVLVMDARLVVAHPTLYLVYESLAEQLAIAAGGLVVYAGVARIDEGRAASLARAGRIAFGLCAIVFGGAHFAYMNMTAPLAPKWLPPSQLFWAYATGVFQVLAGLAMISGVQARLAAILLTLMYALFAPLVHLPRVFAHPADAGAWIESATNLALTGVAWAVADSLARSRSEAA